MGIYHVPALLKETLDGLKVKQGGKYIDCTLGSAGHTKEILRLGGIVLGIDTDIDAQEFAKKLNLQNLLLCQGNFAHLKEIAEEKNFSEVDGILFDLGVSTHQLETESRGFSFNTSAPLDMRMDQSLAVKASDLVNGLNEGELSDLIYKLGEERFAKRIAREIVSFRKTRPVTTCDDLAKIILKVRPRSRFDRTHPATRTFQALRIAVNDELNSLKDALSQAVDLLKPEGKIAVISFHSLEDRIVKNFFKQNLNLKIITDKPITPSKEEVLKNPRARSAKLRLAKKL